MKIKSLHDWRVNTKKARELQEQLREKIIFKPLKKNIKIVAGCDVSFAKKSNEIYAGVVIMQLPGMQVIEKKFKKGITGFPYIPGFLSFREIPVLAKVFQKIECHPELILCDGQGMAHPRFFGLACHLGLILNMPTIGCAKSRLVGDAEDVGLSKGDYSDIYFKEKKVGLLIRSRSNVKPIYVSPGHLIDIPSCYKIVMDCLGKYRIPEPTRLAHILVNEYRKEFIG